MLQTCSGAQIDKDNNIYDATTRARLHNYRTCANSKNRLGHVKYRNKDNNAVKHDYLQNIGVQLVINVVYLIPTQSATAV